MNVQEYFDSLSNNQVLELAEECNNDLLKASRDNPESEWHEACFATMVLTAQEMNKRGLKRGQ